MVIGNGMLSKRFADYESNQNIIILASGVSNSKELSQLEFIRETKLVKQYVADYPDKLIVYFSTSSMYDPMSKNSLYTQHKINIENYIIERANKYNIFRVSQIIGRANNKTLINYILSNIVNQTQFEIWNDATRNLIDLDDVFKIVDYILKNKLYINKTVNIANPYNINILELVGYVEHIVGIKGNYNVIDCGEPFEIINVERILPIIGMLNINFSSHAYYVNAIRKLFSINNV